jgi:pantoate--beta-alanine ligase
VAKRLEAVVVEELLASDARVDYVAVVDGATLEPLVRAQDDAVLAVAAFVGKTRLIDNHVLGRELPF